MAASGVLDRPLPDTVTKTADTIMPAPGGMSDIAKSWHLWQGIGCGRTETDGHSFSYWSSQDFMDTLKRREEQAGGSTDVQPIPALVHSMDL